MSDKSQIEKLSFESWWNKKGFNSVLLRVAAWEAWMARAELQQQDPDEWVIQDRVPVRVGDRISWHYDNVENSVEAGCFSVGAKHGDVSHGNRLRVWCRRRDLPKGKQKTRVRLWVSQSAVIVRDANSKGFGKEIHHDAEGFYIEE